MDNVQPMSKRYSPTDFRLSIAAELASEARGTLVLGSGVEDV